LSYRPSWTAAPRIHRYQAGSGRWPLPLSLRRRSKPRKELQAY